MKKISIMLQFLLLIIITTHLCNGMELELYKPDYLIHSLDETTQKIKIAENQKSNDSKKKQLGYDAQLLLLFKNILPDELKKKIILDLMHSKAYELLQNIESKSNPEMAFRNTQLSLEEKINFCTTNYFTISDARAIARAHTSKTVYNKKQLENLCFLNAAFEYTNILNKNFKYKYRQSLTATNLKKAIEYDLPMYAILLLVPTLTLISTGIESQFCQPTLQPHLIEQNIVTQATNEFYRNKHLQTGQMFWLSHIKELVNPLDSGKYHYIKTNTFNILASLLLSLFVFQDVRRYKDIIPAIIEGGSAFAVCLIPWGLSFLLHKIVSYLETSIRDTTWILIGISITCFVTTTYKLMEKEKTYNPLDTISRELKREDIVIV